MPGMEWGMLAPLVALTLAACIILLLTPRGGGGGGVAQALALAGFVAALGATLLLTDAGTRVSTFGGMLVLDRVALYMSAVILMAGLLATLVSSSYLARVPIPAGEYYALLLLAALGMIIMAATHNLLVLFLGLEILSVALYVLCGSARDWPRPLEAALKYFLLGAFSTGFILYGMAFLYGATGALDLVQIGRHLGGVGTGASPPGTPALLFGLGLMLAGLGFKVAAVPFHWWAPDVYEGAPTPITAFMAVGTKAAAFVALLRLVIVAFGDTLTSQWTMAIGGLALLTMVLGNFVALTQRNVKRLLAWSSVAHGGYLLMAVAAGSDLGTRALLFYFASYVLTTAGAFAVAAIVAETGPDGDEGYGLLRYYGLGYRHPALAVAMGIFMLSLTGLPPTSGFIGKYFIFQSVMQRALDGSGGSGLFLLLALAGVVTSVVSAAYYLRVVAALWMNAPEGEPPAARIDGRAGLAIALTAAGVLLLGLHPAPIYNLTQSVHAVLQALAATRGLPI